jgi:hypothetical protein
MLFKISADIVTVRQWTVKISNQHQNAKSALECICGEKMKLLRVFSTSTDARSNQPKPATGIDTLANQQFEVEKTRLECAHQRYLQHRQEHGC